MPKAIATIEMRIIGLEKELSFPLMIFLARNNSKFNCGTTLVRGKSMHLNICFVKTAALFVFLLIITTSCHTQSEVSSDNRVVLGNEQFENYLPYLKQRKVALVANHTSIVNGQHLVDVLVEKGIKVQSVFTPEHGFRGNADAGEKVKDGIDHKTGLPIISLYGKNKKPRADQLKLIDVILFDIQDVGARFYTYISTLHYVMEAAAESGIEVIVLDRPNPNGYYVDGPVLKPEFKSFVGMHPIPIVHGMTVGELAQMINREKWLANGVQCKLRIIPVLGYSHADYYSVEIAPSPNLPNDQSINLYPTLCLFEGTPVSVGRGTDFPFQQFGHPSLWQYSHGFRPKSGFGAKQPKLEGKDCFGRNLKDVGRWKALELSFLIQAYEYYPNKNEFFTSFFDLLAGTDQLKKQITKGVPEEEIKASWQADLAVFKKTRKKYLLYPDFE